MWNVLIVEDEVLARNYLHAVIKKTKSNFQVIGEASNGEEAVRFIREHKPHLVVTDIIMPLMDGVQLLRQMREEGFDCSFIMLTCMSDFEYARLAIEYGASSYILKLSMDITSMNAALDKIERELNERAKLHKFQALFKDEEAINNPTDHVEINKIIRYLYEHLDENIALSDMAVYVCMDASYLSYLFKKKTGQTLTHYLQKIRIDRAKVLLLETDSTVSDVGEKVGFVNDNYFIKTFRKWMNMTPSDYRKQSQIH